MARNTPQEIAKAISNSVSFNLIEAGAQQQFSDKVLSSIVRLVEVSAEKAILIDRMQEKD